MLFNVLEICLILDELV
uniref:Uncharacterized protein n=1 Tax=Arundo donax TaxID=35708 RepID=A0A0A9BVL9_ARUDO